VVPSALLRKLGIRPLEGAKLLRHLDSITRHHGDHVRTTLTLDRDVAEALGKEMRQSGRGLKATIKDALRYELNDIPPGRYVLSPFPP
jgi:hypothetical protein